MRHGRDARLWQRARPGGRGAATRTVPLTTIGAPVTLLGESATWAASTGTLYWVDIYAGTVYRWSSDRGDGAPLRFDAPVGYVCLADRDRLLVATGSGLQLCRPSGDAPRLYRLLPGVGKGVRFNEGRCDRQGRLWFGSMIDPSREPVGALHRLSEGRIEKYLDGIIVPNCLAFSPRGDTMYFADTRLDTIWRFEYDPDTGQPGRREVFASTGARPGRPDGAAVDDEGFLWVCEYRGWCVARYSPRGELDAVLHLPTANPTSCAFGGDGLRTLFITTATRGIDPVEVARQPCAGKVLAVVTGHAGVPEAAFRAADP